VFDDRSVPLTADADARQASAASAAIDLRAESARTASMGDQAPADLWRAVFALPRWVFIARTLENGTRQPLAVIDDEHRPMMLAFTSAARAHAAAERRGALDGTTEVVGVPPIAVVEGFEQYARSGVQGIVFDEGSTGFSLPLKQLPSLHAAVGAPA
jgi:hypothetical protein